MKIQLAHFGNGLHARNKISKNKGNKGARKRILCNIPKFLSPDQKNSCLIVVNKNVNAKRNQCCFKINEVSMLTLDPTT